MELELIAPIFAHSKAINPLFYRLRFKLLIINV